MLAQNTHSTDLYSGTLAWCGARQRMFTWAGPFEESLIFNSQIAWSLHSVLSPLDDTIWLTIFAPNRNVKQTSTNIWGVQGNEAPLTWILPCSALGHLNPSTFPHRFGSRVLSNLRTFWCLTVCMMALHLLNLLCKYMYAPKTKIHSFHSWRQVQHTKTNKQSQSGKQAWRNQVAKCSVLKGTWAVTFGPKLSGNQPCFWRKTDTDPGPWCATRCDKATKGLEARNDAASRPNGTTMVGGAWEIGSINCGDGANFAGHCRKLRYTSRVLIS